MHWGLAFCNRPFPSPTPTYGSRACCPLCPGQPSSGANLLHLLSPAFSTSNTLPRPQITTSFTFFNAGAHRTSTQLGRAWADSHGEPPTPAAAERLSHSDSPSPRPSSPAARSHRKTEHEQVTPAHARSYSLPPPEAHHLRILSGPFLLPRVHVNQREPPAGTQGPSEAFVTCTQCAAWNSRCEQETELLSEPCAIPLRAAASFQVQINRPQTHHRFCLPGRYY